jgi:hypothetical protein
MSASMRNEIASASRLVLGKIDEHDEAQEDTVKNEELNGEEILDFRRKS